VAPKKGEARASSCPELPARLAYAGVSAIVGCGSHSALLIMTDHHEPQEVTGL
jgi:hypothetical protein